MTLTTTTILQAVQKAQPDIDNALTGGLMGVVRRASFPAQSLGSNLSVKAAAALRRSIRQVEAKYHSGVPVTKSKNL